MISNLQIQNFKCFQNSPLFRFSKINLLTGINGRGKSSLLQSILILSQSAWKDENIKNLIINSELVKLGNFDDIKNSETPRGEKIHLNINVDDEYFEKISFQFCENENDPLSANLFDLKFTERVNATPKSVGSVFKRIHFVSADRLGPVRFTEKNSLPEFTNVGINGEHYINILANSTNLPLVDNRLYRGQDSRSLLQQTEEWLNYILEGAKIDLIGKEKESSVLSILLNSRKNSYSYKPYNVGFGYSYILPLIIAGLIAKPGDIIIVENPEAHLHPRAQSKITEFFARVCSCGIQVFIESHSEHILNSLRVCALNPEIEITHTDISAIYFSEDFSPVMLDIDEKGKIANWPEGFFDQQEIDLSNIFKYNMNS